MWSQIPFQTCSDLCSPACTYPSTWNSLQPADPQMSPTLKVGVRRHLQPEACTSVSCNLPVRSTVTLASRLQPLLAVGHGTSVSSVSRKMLSGALLCGLNDGIVDALSTDLIAQLSTCKHLSTICPLEVLPFCQHLFTIELSSPPGVQGTLCIRFHSSSFRAGCLFL